MSVADSISLSYSYLREGESINSQLCPACGGGHSKEKSLTVSRRKSRLVWRCWRDGCQSVGMCNDGGSLIVKHVTKQTKWLNYRLRKIPEDRCELLQNKVCNRLLDDCLWTDDLGGRYAFPVYDASGSLKGRVLRSYDKDSAHTKALIDVGDYTGCAWSVNGEHPDIVMVVEDIPSAARCATEPGVTGCALMGTHISDGKAEDIKDSKARRYYICLDPGALSSAVRQTVMLRNSLPLTVIPLSKDIKDMSPEEFEALMASLKEHKDD